MHENDYKSVGRILGWIAVVSATFAIVFAAWPLSTAIRAFRDAKLKSKPLTFTKILNLVSLLLTMTLLFLYLILEIRFFILQDYYGEADYKRLTNGNLILLGVVALVRTVTTYSFSLVVLDRFRIFKNVIDFPNFLLPALHVLGFLCFLVSFVIYCILFSQRIESYLPLPWWSIIKLAIQIYSLLLDISVTANIVWKFYRDCQFADGQKFGIQQSKKSQVYTLLSLMILLDFGALVFGIGANYKFPLIAAVAQFIGENMFGIHIVVGLAVLFKLKAVTESLSLQTGDKTIKGDGIVQNDKADNHIIRSSKL